MEPTSLVQLQGNPSRARGEAMVATCSRPTGLDSPETQLHPAPTAGALIAAEGARSRQGQGVKRVTVRSIADTDHRAVAKALGAAGAGTWGGGSTGVGEG